MSSAQTASATASNSNTASSAASTGASSNTNTAKSTATSAASSGGSSTASSATSLPNISDSSTSASSSSSSSSSVSSISDAPSLSSSNGGILSLSGLPTLSGQYSYPAASVPPTQNAPYMRTSHLPENFVFILVGGVLAFVMVIVVLWRFLSAWSINRSFKKDSAAMYTALPDLKKKPVKSDSAMDMADLSGAKLPKSFNSVPSLFFSPTAEVARQSMVRPQSQHMPSGHYRDASKGGF